MFEFLLRFLLSFVRGMGGPDLDKWIRNLPGAIGQELATIVKGSLGNDGKATIDTEKRISEWVKTKGKDATSLIAVLLDGVSTLPAAGGSLLDGYLQVLNLIAAAISETHSSLVLRGFVHDKSFLSYWKLDLLIKSGSRFEQDRGASMIHGRSLGIVIHLLSENYSSETLVLLNKQIRNSRFRQLDSTLESGSQIVRAIYETRVEMEDESSHTIPSGAPALIELVDSLYEALDAQAAVFNDLQKTLEAIKTKRGP